MTTLLHDVRYGLRMLAKSPGFTAVAVITLALGIAVNTAMFSVINATLLRWPFPNPQELVVVSNTYASQDEATPSSYPDFGEWRKQSRAFSELTALFTMNLNYVGGREPQRIVGAQVAEGYFKALGIEAMRGRTLGPADHRAEAAPVCVLSSAFWQREFGGDPTVIGKTLSLNGAAYTVLGVLPESAPRFNKEEIWTPLEPAAPWKNRGTNYLTIIGRLKPGVTLSAARADVDTIQQRINNEFPGNKHGIEIKPLSDYLVAEIRPVLLVLLAAVGFVLLIACANIANLLLTRAAARTREFAVRRALGASPLLIARQLLTESLVLALAGGVLGITLAMWLSQVPLKVWPAAMRRPTEIPIDGRVLAFTIAASLLAGVLFGVAPALRGFAHDVSSSLKEGSSQAGDSRGQRRTREVLVIAEVALAMVLAAGAVLTMRSFSRLVNTDPGFDAKHLLTLRVSLSPVRYKEPAQRVQFVQQALELIDAVPGVGRAAAAMSLPMSGNTTSGDFQIEGRPPFPPEQAPFADDQFITPSYFATLGIPLIKGRVFTDQDNAKAPLVAIINETMAKRFWPAGDALGHRIGGGHQWLEIVGIVGDVKNKNLTIDSGLQIYLSAAQFANFPSWSIAVRGASDPSNLIEPVKQAIFAIDRQQPISNVSLMDQTIASSVSSERASTFLLGLFAALALLLAIVGIYGVIAYSVAQRTHELGVRMALGAARADIVRLVVGLGVRLAGIGVLAGLAAAIGVTRALRSVLFGIGSFDAVAFTTAAALVVAAALLATYLPAHRATRVDPMVALRYE